MKNLFTTILMAGIMMLVSDTTFAASGTNYEVEVGKTLRLDISDLLKSQWLGRGSSSLTERRFL